MTAEIDSGGPRAPPSPAAQGRALLARRPGLSTLAALLALAGCSLFCRFDDVVQPCDSSGGCLPGFACAAGLCVPAGDGGASSPMGCASDSNCPAGACVAGGCSAHLTAWDGGVTVPAELSCEPWPPPTAYGQPLATLSGCLVALPGDQLGPAGKVVGDGGPTVQPFEDGFAIGPARPVVAESPASCPSGLGYSIDVPVGQPFEVVVSGAAQGWSSTENAALALDPVREASQARRDLGVLSASGWSRLAAALGSDGGETLAAGIVRDCAGAPLSGAALEITGTDGGGRVAFLGVDGAFEAGRGATERSGLFALAIPPGGVLVEIAGSAADGGTLLAAVPLQATVGGSAWIDPAPSGH